MRTGVSRWCNLMDLMLLFLITDTSKMAYAFPIGNRPSNQAPSVQRSAKSLKLNNVLRFGQSGCLLERRGSAEAALPIYRQMPRYRRQARREMPSFFHSGLERHPFHAEAGREGRRRPPITHCRRSEVIS
jgi:hypothetical protein